MGERYTVKADPTKRRDIWAVFQGEPPNEIEYEKAEPYTEFEQRVLDATRSAIEKIEGNEVHCAGCDGEDRGESVPNELRDLLRSIERHDKRLTPLTESEARAQNAIANMLYPSIIGTPLMADLAKEVRFGWVEDRLNPGQ